MLHNALKQLIPDLEEFESEAGTIADVRRRLAWAQRIEHDSIAAHRAIWDRTIAQIAASEHYGGLPFEPQLGLVPLGPDPKTGLQEFAHLASGKPVTRDTVTGQLVLGDDMGIVFVLVPLNRFRMGCTVASDPLAVPHDLHDHEVRLDLHFIAKFEITQHQWFKLTGARPSKYAAGKEFYGRLVTARHPVENVSWSDGRRALRQYALDLPTEAQWEHAIRAGTTAPWHTATRSALELHANLLDETAKLAGFRAVNSVPESWEDGHVIHAPVGSMQPNAWGLHDMAGNIWEWCRDRYARRWGEYDVDPGTGEHLVPDDVATGPHFRIGRGGCFGFDARLARSAARAYRGLDDRDSYWGLRAARAVLSR